MRGAFVDQGGLFSYISAEARVPKNHPLRTIRELVRDVLGELNRSLSRLYASEGRPSIPPEQLLSALLLQVFYGIRLDHPLRRTGQRIAAGRPLTIVAIGSSSTSGAGASSPAMNYPSRLAVELKTLLPRAEINVINRGVGGETARDMLARFDEQVIAEKPDVVIWQVGSNSVLRDQPLAPAGTLIREGLRKLKSAGADVILMNPQYAPKVNVKHDAELMVDLIDRAAKEAHVDLFQRFAVMRYWRLTEGIPFETFVSPDGLHLNDWSYGCLAKLLAGAIAEAAIRPVVHAGAGAGAR